MGSTLTAVVLGAGGDWPGVEGSMLLLGVVLLACAGTGLLFAISVVAWSRRRSRRYLLIAVAVGALFLRSIVGIGTVFGAVPMVVHHLVEHSFDFLIAALILYAVIRNRPTRLETRFEDTPSRED